MHYFHSVLEHGLPPSLNQGESKHGQRTFGISYEGCYARKNLAFRLKYLFAIINKISIVAVAQLVRRWSSGHRVVQAEGSSPGEDIY